MVKPIKEFSDDELREMGNDEIRKKISQIKAAIKRFNPKEETRRIKEGQIKKMEEILRERGEIVYNSTRILEENEETGERPISPEKDRGLPKTTRERPISPEKDRGLPRTTRERPISPEKDRGLPKTTEKYREVPRNTEMEEMIKGLIESNKLMNERMEGMNEMIKLIREDNKMMRERMDEMMGLGERDKILSLTINMGNRSIDE